jgi:ribonuclease-3
MLTPEKLNALSQKLGHTFRDQSHLMTALTHRSFKHEHADHLYATNERLEFLGDAVLNLIVAQELFARHASLPEGQLSKLRSFAVNEETLAAMARHLRLADFLFLGRGEEKVAAEKDAILADALEAVLGAIYQDANLAAAQTAFWRWNSEMKQDLLDPRHLDEFDAKSKLQEYCLKTWQELPSYEAKAAQDANFQVTLLVHGRPLLSTQQISKKKAEHWLAKTCLQNQLHLSLG